MPIPKPIDTEDKPKFISRCISDSVMTDEYPDNAQRRAVCETAWKGSSMACPDDDEKKNMGKDEEEENNGFEMEREIFAVGKWNGMEFKEEDLNAIAAAFNTLKKVHRVPLKIGHNEGQPMTDGQMALGWVSEVWVSGEKLLAKFTNMPEVVYQAVNKGLYRNLSIELDFGVTYKGNYFSAVLSGVALLGADIPAVNTLADLTAFLTRGTEGYKCLDRVCFIAAPNTVNRKSFILDRGNDMADDAKIAELEAKLKKATDDASAYRTRLEASEKQAKTMKFAQRRKDFATKAEGLVTAKKITPATRDKMVSEIAETEDEEVFAKVEFALDMLAEAPATAGLPTGETATYKRDTASSDPGSGEEDFGANPSVVVADRVAELQTEYPNMQYKDAMATVFRRDKKLAAAWSMMNVA